MVDSLLTVVELSLLIPAAALVAWSLRRAIRLLTRRAMRLAQRRPGMWRVRSRRFRDLDGEIEARRRQRADAAARMFGHVVTGVIFVVAFVVALHVVGVDPLFAISSAGFVGLAIALSGQDLIKNLLAGTVALLEDRYAVGDEVVVRVSGADLQGTIDLMGAASIRLRTPAGATMHVAHGMVESVTNLSQMPAVRALEVPTEEWARQQDSAVDRLAAASNDVGLTGVVFLGDVEAYDHPSGTTTVRVRSNLPLSDEQTDRVRERLVGRG